MVPQGGNTGLVGGQTPDLSGEEIIVSTQRLRAIREVDLDSNVMICEAGVTLGEAQAAALAADRLFPLSLASEGSMHDRRQHLDQRRRRDRHRLWQHARPRDRRRGGARRRPHRQRA